jgi:hypothetical protein
MPNIKCPHCEAVSKAKDGLPAGARIVCPKCREPITVPAPSPAKKPPASAERQGVRRKAPVPAAKRREAADEADDRPTPKKRKKRKSRPDRSNLIIGGVVGGIVLLAAAITAIVLSFGPPATLSPPAVAQRPAAPPPAPVPPPPVVSKVPEPQPAPAPPPPVAPPAVETPAKKPDDARPSIAPEAQYLAIILKAAENVGRVTVALDAMHDEKSVLENCDTINRETKDLQEIGKSLLALGKPDIKDIKRFRAQAAPYSEAGIKFGNALAQFQNGPVKAALPPNSATRAQGAVQAYFSVTLGVGVIMSKYGI